LREKRGRNLRGKGKNRKRRRGERGGEKKKKSCPLTIFNHSLPNLKPVVGGGKIREVRRGGRGRDIIYRVYLN